MPRKRLNQDVLTIGTGTVIYSKESNYRDVLYLQAANISSSSASLDLLMGGNYVMKGHVIEPNSPLYLLADSLVCFSTITADCVPSSAVAVTGWADR